MAEQLQVGPGGSAGPAVDIGTAQVRVRWHLHPEDVPSVVVRDAEGRVLRRFPGADLGDVVVDGDEWLFDLARVDVTTAAVELLVQFAGHRVAGLVATVGQRTLGHPGSRGDADQQRLLARLERRGAAWALTAANHVVLTDDAPQPEVHRVGRLLVLVDSSGSMAGPLDDGRVTAAVVDAVQSTGRPSAVVRASDGTGRPLHRASSDLQGEVATFVAELARQPRTSTADLLSALRTLAPGEDDDLVVVTDAAPADVVGIHAALGRAEATWLVVGSPALATTSADRRRWDALEATGRVTARVLGA